MYILNKKYLSDFLWFIFIAIVFLTLDNFYAKERFAFIGGFQKENFTISEYIRQLIFISEYLIAFAIIYTCLRIKKRYSVPLIIIIWVLILIDLNFHNIAGKPAGITNIAVLNGAIGNTQDAMMEYSNIIIKNLISTSILFLPILLGIILNKKNINVLFCLAPVTLLAAIYIVILLIRGEPALIGFPKGFSYGFGSLSLKVNDVLNAFKKPSILQIKKISDSQFNKIIVVMDESINYPEFADLHPESHSEVINYGRAFSGANCSAASNFILRRAGWKKNFASENINIQEIESIFSIAQKAGYKTVYMDNQHVLKDPSVNNYFDPKEIAKINSVIAIEGEDYTRDLSSLPGIFKALEQPKAFIFINKVGAHFPYENTIPPNLRTDNRLENYKKSLEINSANFINQLIPKIDDQTIIFYTSDHGQNLTGRTSHCNIGTDVTDTEYTVPFLLITKNETFKNNLLANKAQYENKLTHLELSESIRNVMGYAVDGIDSIFKKPEHIKNSYCGVYGSPKPIFGIKPKCHLLNQV